MIEEAPRAPDRGEPRALLDVLARAFRDNPMNVEIHGPNPARRVRANRAGLRALVLDSESPIISMVIHHRNRVAGGFILAPPSVRVVPAPSLWRQIGCFWQQGAQAMDRWGQVSAELAQIRPLVPHWYLSVLGVDPDCQRQGLGARLLGALAALVAADPAPIYLECDRVASVDFYRQHGFVVREEIRIHEVPCWGMGRGFADEKGDLCDPVRQA